MRSDLVDIDVRVHARTTRGILVSSTGSSDDAVWLPLSEVEVLDLPRGRVILTLPQGLAEDRRLV